MSLDNQLRTQLIELLASHPPLTTRAGRDAWLMNLPDDIRNLILARHEHCKTDLAFIIDAVKGLQLLEDGRRPISILIDASLSEMVNLTSGQKLKELRQKIEEDSSSPVPHLQEWPVQNRKEWLKYHKFRLDPFLYTDGANDPYLSQYFYRAGIFGDVLRDPSRLETILVFGADGSGKSSLRNAIMQVCRKDGIMPVVYQDFGELVAKHEEGQSIQAQDHVTQILKIVIRILAEDADNRTISLSKSGNNRVIRNHLWLYVSEYENDPAVKQKLEDFLMPDRGVSGSLPKDYRESLDRLCRYVTKLLGYTCVYILVDPADDISPDSDVAWQILEPLLTAHRLLELPDYEVTFKFFMNQKFSERALQIPWIGQQQSKRVYYLEWSDDELHELLRERLKRCSERQPPYVSLGELSEVDNLDERAIQLSGGKPRELIAICNRLFSEHCHSPVGPDRLFITREEVDKALAPFLRREKESELERLLAQGEGSKVEFKTAMRYDLKEKKRNKEMDKVIAKTLCGFMNTEGGILIIGVDDDGNAMGLDVDIFTLDKKNEDGFELAFNDIVKSYLELPDRRYIGLKFWDYRGKRICVIQIEGSREPVFCLLDQGHEFYVRVGNSTRRLDAKETVEYVRAHFKEHLHM